MSDLYINYLLLTVHTYLSPMLQVGTEYTLQGSTMGENFALWCVHQQFLVDSHKQLLATPFERPFTNTVERLLK